MAEEKPTDEEISENLFYNCYWILKRDDEEEKNPKKKEK